MSKLVKFLLIVLLVLSIALAGMILVPRYLLGIDIFDRSGWDASTGQHRYLDYRGDPITGWQTIDGNWYYFEPGTGNMATHWLELEGNLHYLGADGVLKTGWLTLSDGKYYADPENNAALTGWQELEGKTYYFDEKGRMADGLQAIGTDVYLFSPQGQVLSGWAELEGSRYYLTNEGLVQTGWVNTEHGSSYFASNGTLCTGWTETDKGRYYLTDNGTIATGWVETESGRLYLDESGLSATGWIDAPEGRYFLTEDSVALTGWQELDGKTYYFREDGRMAIGKVIIEDKTWYFSSFGQVVPLVNRWNSLHEDYEVELVKYGSHDIAADAYDSLVAMINQIKTLGYYKVTSIHRSMGTQQYIWDKYYNGYIAVGCSRAEAERLTGQTVAVPGTSEHHLGYAVDIDGVKPVHNWLAEHSWEYGFIVRFPEGTSEITGIQHEPWHFRYVGKELAKELFDLGITLEEYMDMLTKKAGSDAGTASDPEIYG